MRKMMMKYHHLASAESVIRIIRVGASRAAIICDRAEKDSLGRCRVIMAIVNSIMSVVDGGRRRQEAALEMIISCLIRDAAAAKEDDDDDVQKSIELAIEAPK